MRAKQFFYVCAGLFLLVAAYSLGASKVESQTTPDQTVAAAYFAPGGSGLAIVVTTNGDVYYDSQSAGLVDYWHRAGNVFATRPISVEGKTWSGVKEGYRKK
jgi:hypothetical protein